MQAAAFRIECSAAQRELEAVRQQVCEEGERLQQARGERQQEEARRHQLQQQLLDLEQLVQVSQQPAGRLGAEMQGLAMPSYMSYTLNRQEFGGAHGPTYYIVL